MCGSHLRECLSTVAFLIHSYILLHMLHTRHHVTRVAQRTAKAPFRVTWRHASPQRSATQPRLRIVVHSSQSASLTDEQQAESAWDQLRLLQRCVSYWLQLVPVPAVQLTPSSVDACSKMDMAVANEDYSLAAQARDQYNVSHWLSIRSLHHGPLGAATGAVQDDAQCRCCCYIHPQGVLASQVQLLSCLLCSAACCRVMMWLRTPSQQRLPTK